jgi:hypothetical protein
MGKLRNHLSYANVMATIAVFAALGGSAVAAGVVGKNKVTSKSVRNGSLQGLDVKDGSLQGSDVAGDTLTGANINESTLTLSLPCPGGTTKAAGLCFETTQRADAGLDSAMSTCGQANRFLPTVAELRTLHAQAGVSVNGEQASDLGQDTSHSALGADNGLSISSSTSFPRPFRCAVVPG